MHMVAALVWLDRLNGQFLLIPFPVHCGCAVCVQKLLLSKGRGRGMTQYFMMCVCWQVEWIW